MWSEVAQSCPTLCDPMDCSLPGSSVHGIFQARVLEWVAISFSRGSSWPRDWTRVSRIAGRHFTVWATREVLNTRVVPSNNLGSHPPRSGAWAGRIIFGGSEKSQPTVFALLPIHPSSKQSIFKLLWLPRLPLPSERTHVEDTAWCHCPHVIARCNLPSQDQLPTSGCPVLSQVQGWSCGHLGGLLSYLLALCPHRLEWPCHVPDVQ